MAQTILGVDLGTYSVKIAQVERGFGEFRLTHYFEVPLVAEEVLSYPQAAFAALSKFVSDNPIAHDTCVISLPGNKVSYRVLDLPFVNAKKIDQTLEFELETLVPFDIEDLEFDYTILGTQQGSSRVLATYLPTDTFQNFLQHLQTSPLDPRYVGVDAVDLSYLTLLGGLPPEGRYAILDMGHSKANFIILEGNSIRSLRSFSWGGAQLTTEIAKVLGGDTEAAEAYKHKQAQLVLHPNDEVGKVLLQSFDELALSLKQTLFAFAESGEVAIEALYLCGGTSRLPGVEAYFSQKLNINVSLLDLLEDAHSQIHDRDQARSVIPTALGAAMHGVFPNKGARINFRRGEHAYRKDFEQLGGSFKRLGILAACVVLMGMIYFIISYMTLSSQVDEMNLGITKLIRSAVTDVPKTDIRSAKSAISLLEGKIGSLQDKLHKAQGSSSLSALRVLQMISSAMPPRDELQIDIDDINITPQRVRLEGRALSYEGVDKIKSSMEKIPQFKNVQTGNVRKGLRDEIKFSLSFDIVEEGNVQEEG